MSEPTLPRLPTATELHRFLTEPPAEVTLPPLLHLGECNAEAGEPVCMLLDTRYGCRSEALGWKVYRLVMPHGNPALRITAYDFEQEAHDANEVSEQRKLCEFLDVFVSELSRLTGHATDEVTPVELAIALADIDNPHEGAHRVHFQRVASSTDASPAPPVVEG